MSGGVARVAVTATLAFALPASAQNLGAEAHELIKNSGAPFGCLVNGSLDLLQRDRVNALVWKGSPGDWRAVVAKTDIVLADHEQAPCWNAPGRCAVYQGPLPDFDKECSPTRPGLDFAPPSNKLLIIKSTTVYGAPVLRGAENLMRLAGGLEARDTLVTAMPNADFYMSAEPDGVLRARVVIGSQTVRIARLRSAPATLDVTALLRQIKALASTDLATAGPLGAVSASGLVVYGRKCFQLAEPDTFLARLQAAESVLSLSVVPAPGPGTKAALDDLLHDLIGSDFAHGRAAAFTIEQDPRLFISQDGEETTCPGSY